MDLDLLVSKTNLLPASSSLLVRLRGLLDDAETTPEDITKCVESEANIAGQVIRVANSVAYAGRQKCGSIQEAVTRVGFNEIYRIVGGLIANELYLTDLSAYGMDEGDLWYSSIRMAAAMRALCSCIPEEEKPDEDAVYTIGLMHNVGIVLINNYHLQEGIEDFQEGVEYLNWELELRYLGFTHADAAGALMEKWNFPDSVHVPVRYQYAPDQLEPYRITTSLLYACKYANEYENMYPEDPYSEFELPEELAAILPVSQMDVMDAVVERGSELKRLLATG